MNGWQINRDGKLLVGNLPGPAYASVAFSNYACLQDTTCKMELLDPKGAVVVSIDLDESRVQSPMESAAKLEDIRKIIDAHQAEAEERHARESGAKAANKESVTEVAPQPAKAVKKASKKAPARPKK